MIMRAVSIGVAWLAFAFLTLTSPAPAQSPIAGFPPGTFQSRAAIDGGTVTGPFSLIAGDNGGSGATGSTTINYGTLNWGSGCNAVIAVIFWYNTNSADTISSVSLGAAASQVANAFAVTGTLGQSIDVWQLNSPVGTSGAVSVIYSGIPSFNSNVTVYCLTSNNTTAGTANHNAGACGGGLSAAVTIPTSGAAVVGSGSVAGQVISFTNATSDGVYIGGLTQDRWGHTTATGSVTVTSTSAAADTCSLTVVPYGP